MEGHGRRGSPSREGDELSSISGARAGTLVEHPAAPALPTIVPEADATDALVGDVLDQGRGALENAEAVGCTTAQSTAAPLSDLMRVDQLLRRSWIVRTLAHTSPIDFRMNDRGETNEHSE